MKGVVKDKSDEGTDGRIMGGAGKREREGQKGPARGGGGKCAQVALHHSMVIGDQQTEHGITARKHAHARARKHASTHTHTHTHVQTHARAHTHTHSLTHTLTHAHLAGGLGGADGLLQLRLRTRKGSGGPRVPRGGLF